MKITFIGTASGLSVLNRSHASILFDDGANSVLLDCGEGTTNSFLRQGIDTGKIDRIFISHCHPDHCSGLPLLLQYMHLIHRDNKLDIYLPVGASEAFRRFFEQVYLLNDKLTFDYNIWEYGENALIMDGGMTIKPIPNRHLEGLNTLSDHYRISIQSFSLIVSCRGKCVYYSADLKDIDDLKPPKGMDIIIVESTHISIEDAVRKAEKLNLGKVIMTHVPPELESEKAELTDKYRCEFAYDGMVMSL